MSRQTTRIEIGTVALNTAGASMSAPRVHCTSRIVDGERIAAASSAIRQELTRSFAERLGSDSSRIDGWRAAAPNSTYESSQPASMALPSV